MSRWIPLVLVGACCPPEPAKKVTHTLPHRLAKRAHDASAAFCKYADTFIDEANSLPRDRSRELTAMCHIRTFAPTMFSRCSGSDTRINEPGKRAEPVLKIPSAFRSPLAQTARVWGIVAAVSLVDIGTLDLAAGEPLSGFDDGAQRVAVIRIAGQRPGVQHKLATRCSGIGGDDGSFHTEFVRCAGLALADALHLRSVEGIQLPAALALLLRADLIGT